MLIRQLDVFDPLKIRKLRANSNSNSKLELDDFEPSLTAWENARRMLNWVLSCQKENGWSGCWWP